MKATFRQFNELREYNKIHALLKYVPVQWGLFVVLYGRYILNFCPLTHSLLKFSQEPITTRGLIKLLINLFTKTFCIWIGICRVVLEIFSSLKSTYTTVQQIHAAILACTCKCQAAIPRM